MKRDMNLIREIALRLETSDNGLAPDGVEIDGYTHAQVGFHMLLMVGGDLAKGVGTCARSTRRP